jgi:transcriptional regulator with XRE-family HTH domain
MVYRMDDDAQGYFTVNQLVAHNLAKARRLRGWTQEQAAAELEPYLGVRWSKASFSAAERSATAERVRHFTADDIAAFAAAFRLPIAWFFLPAEDAPVIQTGDIVHRAGEFIDLLLDVGAREFQDEALALTAAEPEEYRSFNLRRGEQERLLWQGARKAASEAEVREMVDAFQSSVLELRRLLTRLGFTDLPPTHLPLDLQMSQIRAQLQSTPAPDSAT